MDVTAVTPRFVFSAPGRTELGGNHTDHQHGRVLAAAVDLEIRAEVVENGKNVVCLTSEIGGRCEVALDDLRPRPSERGTTAALVRGVCAGFAALGVRLRGFEAKLTSTVPVGGGLSSSAALEVLLGTIINELFCQRRVAAVEIARIGQRAENEYYGKPCGLMDQTACAVGGVAAIDFLDPAAPVVERLTPDFGGYKICILDTGSDHSNLTDEYAAIPAEMCSVAALFGREVLRDVEEGEFYARLGDVRGECGDRAALRAMHFFDENRRVEKQTDALRRGDLKSFLSQVRKSGRSSWMLLQNVIPAGYTVRQDAALALALADRLLRPRGAVRIHGGGFAGTIQAFVPEDMVETFRRETEAVLGPGRCHVLSVRKEGGVLLN